MTEAEQQESDMKGNAGDEAQYDALMSRTDELIKQYFQLFTVISGSTPTVHVREGANFFVNADT